MTFGFVLVLSVSLMTLGVIGAEIALRLAGILDFPLFQVHRDVGFFPAPNQSGSYLGRKDWVFNDRSMGVFQPFSNSADAVILVGDSIVYGGNSLQQKDKVGPILAVLTRRPVFPLAAGGWSLKNELRMLRENPDFLAVQTIVFVINTGDLGAAAMWQPLHAPTKRPISALLFLLKKYVLKHDDVVQAPKSPEGEPSWQEELRWFLDRYVGRLICVLYPRLEELGQTVPDAFGHLLNQLDGRVEIVSLSSSPSWDESSYRDSIHPSASGNAKLAAFIANCLAR